MRIGEGGDGVRECSGEMGGHVTLRGLVVLCDCDELSWEASDSVVKSNVQTLVVEVSEGSGVRTPHSLPLSSFCMTKKPQSSKSLAA